MSFKRGSSLVQFQLDIQTLPAAIIRRPQTEREIGLEFHLILEITRGSAANYANVGVIRGQRDNAASTDLARDRSFI
jgi:hypothetical protein